jgi:hypothetical protein
MRRKAGLDRGKSGLLPEDRPLGYQIQSRESTERRCRETARCSAACEQTQKLNLTINSDFSGAPIRLVQGNGHSEPKKNGRQH